MFLHPIELLVVRAAVGSYPGGNVASLRAGVRILDKVDDLLSAYTNVKLIDPFAPPHIQEKQREEGGISESEISVQFDQDESDYIGVALNKFAETLKPASAKPAISVLDKLE